MRNSTPLLLVIFCCILSCHTEPELRNFEILLKNETGSIINVEAYRIDNTIYFEDTIEPSESRVSCKFANEKLIVFGCSVDSIVFTFNNSKGYICKDRFNSDELCFSDKTPFSSLDYTNLGNNRYEFVITEEDFNNALDLPE